MRMIQKLKALEKAVVFLRWATDAEFGKIKYVGDDFIEFDILDMDSMEYTETVLINSQLILEVMISGFEIARVIAEMSAKITVHDLDSQL
ncbi:TPA: hypothetical protein IAA86_07475 [Candidatus Galligastranaerophilus intestinavium]|uniref:Uncharacterized protein n=1 Tax=Candidatus Galligastranaerophilus intestinavium TaxID=2840836 RepID=A0A9D1FKG3_9BACT|nr:hypothetical protein [Candidatus Galligastranaerophilus intestinavium]